MNIKRMLSISAFTTLVISSTAVATPIFNGNIVKLKNANGMSFTPFNDGKALPAGQYRLSYVTGAYYIVQNNPDDTPIASWTTNYGLYLSTGNSTSKEIVKMPGFPGPYPHDSSGPYNSQSAIEQINQGRNVILSLKYGVYGLFNNGDISWLPNGNGSPNPEFSLTALSTPAPEPTEILLLVTPIMFMLLKRKRTVKNTTQ